MNITRVIHPENEIELGGVNSSKEVGRMISETLLVKIHSPDAQLNRRAMARRTATQKPLHPVGASR